MVRYHLKRLAMPRTWLVNRKTNKYSVRPTGSGHPFELGLPAVYVFRDLLKIADNTREVRYIIFNKGILVNGKKIDDHRFLIGYLDVITIPELKASYRLVLTDKKKLDVVEIDNKESTLKIKKVLGKTVLKGGKVQTNYSDGTNETSSDKYKIDDSVLFDISSNKVKEVLPLAEKALVAMLFGQYAGMTGTVEKISGKVVFVNVGDKTYEAKRENVFVIGKTTPAVKVSP